MVDVLWNLISGIFSLIGKVFLTIIGLLFIFFAFRVLFYRPHFKSPSDLFFYYMTIWIFQLLLSMALFYLAAYLFELAW